MIMEYQKIINLLDNTPNQPSKFRTKNWVEINDESRGTCNKGSQIRFKRSSLCDYRDSFILDKGTITVTNTAAQDQVKNDVNEKIIFTNYAPFTNGISSIIRR